MPRSNWWNPGSTPGGPSLPDIDEYSEAYWRDADNEKHYIRNRDLYNWCDRNSPSYNPVLCQISGGSPYTPRTGRDTPPGQSGADLGGGGQSDWWSGEPGAPIKNRYEAILNALLDRFIQDPVQKAQGAAAGVVGGMGYDALIDKLLGIGPGGGGTTTAGRKMPPEGSPTWNAIIQAKLAKAGAFGQAYGQSLGPLTSFIGGSGGQLQGYRGQDQQRYLQEMQMQNQLRMAQAQAKAMAAAQGGGGGLWDILGGLAGFVPYLGGLGGGMDWLEELLGMFGGGSGDSGGGMQYTPGWLGGGW